MFTDLRGLRPILFFSFQIAPSAKKLWGVDEGGSKDEGGVKGGGTLLHLGDHQTTMWRDSTWSTSGTISRDYAIYVYSRRKQSARLRNSSTVEWSNRNRLDKRKAHKQTDPKHNDNSVVTFEYRMCTTQSLIMHSGTVLNC